MDEDEATLSDFGPDSDTVTAAQKEEQYKTEYVAILASSGFKNVVLTAVPLPDQVLNWIRADFSAGQEDRAESEVKDAKKGMNYYRVSSDKGTFGLFFTAYMPLLDLEGTGVTPEEYYAGPVEVENVLAGTNFVISLEVSDLRRLGELLLQKAASVTASASAPATASASEAAPAVPAPDDDEEPTLKNG